MSGKTFAQQDYNNIKNENNHVLVLTQEKYNLSFRALKKVQHSLNTIKDELLEKKKTFQELMKINIFRNSNKKKTVLNVYENPVKNRSKSSFKTKRNSINITPILMKKTLNNEKEAKIDIISLNEENKKSKFNAKSNKKYLKMKSDNFASLYFTKKDKIEQNDSNIVVNNEEE